MKKSLLCLLLVLIPAVAAASERFHLEGYARQLDSIPIGVVHFKPTNNVTLRENLPWEIIANNFDFCGKFNVLSVPEFDSVKFAERDIAIYIDGQYTVEGNSVTIECNLRDVATRSLLAGKKYKGETRFLRGMAHRYSNEVVEALFGDKGIFESRIVFVKDEGPRKNIGIMDFDGYNRTMLTNSNAINIFPAFAGKTAVLWTSYTRGRPEIYRGMLSDGTSKVFIQGKGLQVCPSVNPLDGRVAYASSQTGSLNVFVRAADGGSPRQLTFTRGIDTAPNWSPNGYQIAFTSDRAGTPQIYVMDADGANQRRVTHEGRHNDAAAWSPKGDKIAYASVGENHRYHIWTVSVNGSEATKLTDMPGTSEHPTWSPDGNLIAFVNTNGGRSDLYAVRADGTRLRRVTRTGDVKMPNWSGF